MSFVVRVVQALFIRFLTLALFTGGSDRRSDSPCNRRPWPYSASWDYLVYQLPADQRLIVYPDYRCNCHF
jgi:hypothetical protein